MVKKVKNSNAEPKTSWVAPLQKHVSDTTGAVKWITIRVRLFAGDVEQDYNFKFPPGKVKASQLHEAVSDRLNIKQEFRCIFKIWMIGRDLELQLRDNIDIFDMAKNWHTLMSKYTHISASMNVGHPVNRYLIVFRRAAIVDQRLEESAGEHEIAYKLLYGEIRNQLHADRLLPAIKDILRLGGLELQVISNYDVEKYPNFLSGNKWMGLVPRSMHNKMTPEEWISSLKYQHSLHQDIESSTARRNYVQYAKKLPLYGCSHFPCCREIPPAGLFDIRLENYYIAIGDKNVHIIDKGDKTLLASMRIHDLSWTYEKNRIQLNYSENSVKKGWTVISPQTYLIMNVLSRANHLIEREAKVEVVDDQRIQNKINNIILSNYGNTGFFSTTMKRAKQKNDILAARRVSAAHKHAIRAMYGDKNIQMIQNTITPDESN